jgi:TfoX/Sxy family transcriptional regulator of competence genes
MAYNEQLVNQTREKIAQTHEQVVEKKMFGGICFMVNGKLCLGVLQERLLVRADPALFEEILEKENCEPMDSSGKSMKGFVFVEADVLANNNRLTYWVQLALDFNPRAKASPKKKRKVK